MAVSNSSSSGTVNFSIDLEDTLEDNKAPFLPVLEKFLDNQFSSVIGYIEEHPDYDVQDFLEEDELTLEAGHIEGWGFSPFTDFLGAVRGWDEREEDVIDLFLHGEHFFYDDGELDRVKSDYGNVWPGFHPVMGNVFKGRPGEFPVKDERAGEYISQLKGEDFAGRVDVVTSRSDNEVIHERSDEYPVSGDLREGLEKYLSMHGVDEAVDELLVEWDKAGHENGYSVFVDDKPPEYFGLGEGQFQVVLTTVSNEDADIVEFEDLRQRDEYELGGLTDQGYEFDNRVRVYSVEEAFEAAEYVGRKISAGEAPPSSSAS